MGHDVGATDAQEPWLWYRSASGPRAELPRLGQVLREYRDEHGLTQAELAERLGVAQSYVSLLERGKRVIRDVEFRAQIANSLGIPPARLGLADDLVFRTDTPIGHSPRRSKPTSSSG